MKNIISTFLLFITCSAFVFGQVSDEIRQNIITLYTAYAEASNPIERLQYVRDADVIREKLIEYYGDRTIGYTPKRFGSCTEKNGLYTLVEYMEATQFGRAIEVSQNRYFVKVGVDYKLDWESSICYNPISWSAFIALKSSEPYIMRCAANLTDSRYDDYWGIRIYDNVPNYQFTAYINKSSEYGTELFNLLKDGRTYAVILELKYINSNYSKEVVISDFVQRGWFIE
jgi:hypothetical protein